MQGTIGEIKIWGLNFAPRGWAFCHGQTLSSTHYPELSSVMSNNYGGNGNTEFKLPDLRGRVPVGAGQGAGLDQVSLGMVIGQETISPETIEIETHSHTEATDLSNNTNRVARGDQEHSNRQPSLGVNYIICISGDYPSRN